MPDDGVTSDTRSQTPTNLRLLLILEEVARAGEPVSATALADTLGLPKPTMHRLLATAEEQGFLQRDVDGRSYGAGNRLRRLAGNTLSSQRMRTERLMIMKKLAEVVGETCNLAAPGRFGMIYLDRVETHWPLRIQMAIGSQVPFHCTASGKMYLSSMRNDKLERFIKWLNFDALTPHTMTTKEQLQDDIAQIRQRGYAVDDEEFMSGMVAIAVSIKDNLGRLLTTLSIHAPTQRHSQKSLEGALPDLRAAAKDMQDLI